MAQVVVDRENVNDEFVIVRKIYKKNGEVVAAGDLVLDIETSKTAAEIRSPETGMLSIALSDGDEIAVGALLFEIGPRATAPVVATPPIAELSETLTSEPKLSRAAAEIAQRLAIDVQHVPSRGWITSSDVLAAAGKLVVTPQVPAVQPATVIRPESRARGLPKVPFRSERATLRKRIEARSIARANGNGTTSMIGIELLLPGPRLVVPPFLFQDSLSDLVVFEAARLLRHYPELNAFYLDERTNGYFEEVNFGITFDSGSNLKVLALHHADMLSLSDLQAGVDRLLQLYESDAPIEEALLTSSTVTLSDLSRSAADFMLPLLNADQSLIIGVTRRAVDRYGLHASFDHRVSDGLRVAHFLGKLRDRVQSHFRIALTDSTGLNAPRCSACDLSMQTELRLGGRGLLRIVQSDGSDGYLCRNCFQGW